MTRIAEHYSRARNTSNLKSEARTAMSAADILGAAGMAAQEHSDALLMWSVMYGGKSSQKMQLLSGLEERVCGHMLRNKLPGNAREIAMEVMAHYLYAQCQACGGAGYQIIPGTITRSDNPCPECGGSGKPHMPSGDAWQWLHKYVSILLAKAAGKVLDKIDLNM